MNRLLTNPKDFISLFRYHLDDPMISNKEYTTIAAVLQEYVEPSITSEMYYIFKCNDGEFIVLTSAKNIKTEMSGMIPYTDGIIYYGIIPDDWRKSNNVNIALGPARKFLFTFLQSSIMLSLSNIVATRNTDYVNRLAFAAYKGAINRYYDEFSTSEYYDYRTTDILPELFKMQESIDIGYTAIDDSFYKSMSSDKNIDAASYIWHRLNSTNIKKKYPVLIYSVYGESSIIDEFETILGKSMEYLDIMGAGNISMTDHLSRILNDPDYFEFCTILLSNDGGNANKHRENDNLADAVIELTEIDGKINMKVTPKNGNHIVMDIDPNDEMAPYHIMSINPSVKDDFNAINKNGIPKTIEEYQANPMGNPVPIVVEKPMVNDIME